jgi:hypothetical protein
LEAFPDLSTLSDTALRELIQEYERQENEISYQRRLLHGKIGLLRAELVARYQKKGEGALGVDIDQLSTILAGKGPAIDDIDIGQDLEHGGEAAAEADDEGGPGAA